MGQSKKKGGARRPERAEADPPLGLDDVIRQRMALTGKSQKEDGSENTEEERTWAQILADTLITTAAKGDMKAFDVLGRRVGAAPEPAVPAADIDPDIARKILEIVREPVKSRSSD
jgi:hypothetical protein